MNKCGSHSLDLAVSSLQGNKIDGKTILSHFDACPSTFALHVGYEQNSQLTCFLYSHHDIPTCVLQPFCSLSLDQILHVKVDHVSQLLPNNNCNCRCFIVVRATHIHYHPAVAVNTCMGHHLPLDQFIVSI